MKSRFESWATAAAIAALVVTVPAVGQGLGNVEGPGYGPGSGPDCSALQAEKAMLIPENQAAKAELAEKQAAKKSADELKPTLERQQAIEARIAEIKAACPA
jgi:long-subunit fatty acid transport protein